MALVLVLGVAVQTQAQDQPPTPPQGPSGNARQPVITNQFNTVSGGALQQRRPGLTVQQGTAVQGGSTAFFDGNVIDERNFIGQMIRDIFVTILDSINDALSLLNAFGGDGPLSGLTDLIDQIDTTPTTTETTPTTTETAPDITPTPTGTPPDAPPAPTLRVS